MKKILLGIIPLILVGCSKAPTDESTYFEPSPDVPKETSEMFGKTYELDFSDDFDTLKKDGTWIILNQDFGESKAKNGYHIWSKEENASIEDGALKLTVNVDSKTKTMNGSTMVSYERFLLKDTVWEIRFKVDKSLGGDWFVFLISPKHSPKSPNVYNQFYSTSDTEELREITPIELQSTQGNFRSALWLYNTQYNYGSCIDSERKVSIDDSFYDEWHTIKFIWGTDSYTCYLDDVQVYEVYKNDIIKNIPENDLYGSIYLGADLMGEWHGVINPNMPTHSYKVDYVKVWREVK